MKTRQRLLPVIVAAICFVAVAVATLCAWQRQTVARFNSATAPVVQRVDEIWVKRWEIWRKAHSQAK